MFKKPISLLMGLAASLNARLPNAFQFRKSQQQPTTILDHHATGEDWWSKPSWNRNASASGGNKGINKKMLRWRAKKKMGIITRRRQHA